MNTSQKNTKKLPFSSQQWLDQINNFILEHLEDKSFTNADIAKAAFISERQLYRKFKSLTGKTPNQYIHHLRLEKARQLLESNTYDTVKGVALSVGFSRPDYFSKVYEAYFGKRPVEYFDKD